MEVLGASELLENSRPSELISQEPKVKAPEKSMSSEKESRDSRLCDARCDRIDISKPSISNCSFETLLMVDNGLSRPGVLMKSLLPLSTDFLSGSAAPALLQPRLPKGVLFAPSGSPIEAADGGGGCLGGVAVLDAGRFADRTVCTFPFDITKTAQNSGADFINELDRWNCRL